MTAQNPAAGAVMQKGADLNRTLTDADIEAIVGKLKSELVNDFYGEVGRGVWGWLKRVFWAGLLALAVYGMTTGKVPGSSVELRP